MGGFPIYYLASPYGTLPCAHFEDLAGGGIDNVTEPSLSQMRNHDLSQLRAIQLLN